MQRLNDTASNQHTPKYFPGALAVRTYRQIAELLVNRGIPAMTTTRVAHICRAAEMKIARALLADPEFRKPLHRGAAHGHGAARPGWRRAYDQNDTDVFDQCAVTPHPSVRSQS